MSISTFACDICGSGAGGSYFGILPEFRKSFFGLRYQQNSLIHHLGSAGSTTYLTTTETFRIMELWGAVNIGKKFRITGFVPVNFIQRSNQQGTFNDKGLGDISAIGYYQLLNKQNTFYNKLLQQSLWIGGGIKLPTGKYNPDDKNIQQSSQNTFQLGTGSIDFSVNAMYDIRLQNAGINTNISYKINTTNQYDYSYGDKFTMNILGYYKFRTANTLSIAPNVGILLETATKDHATKDLEVWQTGGRSLMGTAGMEFNAGKISVGVNFQTPLSQRLGEGKVKAGDRAMIHIAVTI